MGTRGGRRTAAIVMTALTAGSLSACDNDSPDVSAPSTATSSGVASGPSTSSSAPSTDSGPTSSQVPSSGTATSGATLSMDELTAKIAAGAPPKDLTWRYPEPPASWKKLKTEGGTLQWQVKDRCVLTLGQPAGLGTDAKPTSHDVLEHTAEQTSTAFDGKPKPKYHDQKTRMVVNDVTGFNGTAEVKMEESMVDYGKSVRARIVAYRKGDFALTVTSICGTPQLFKTVSKSDLDPFIAKLQAHTTY